MGPDTTHRPAEKQLARIIFEERDSAGRSAAQIARDLFLTEGRVHQIIPAYRAAHQAE
ncbi:hypothetical protein [Streptomyces sp. 1331.2]|uniref:hypothetical protein n=1 Tax=Streptomyces sp. 1331.2 TaxID=1938835 RepID=UPI00211B7C4E|nr:hypothetical protein [Streptomyces sp. 1331.2]